jgi:hypothetical protein
MWVYFHKCVELAAVGKGHSQQEIADAAGLSVFQVSRWHQRPEFHQALAATFRHVQLVGFERAMNALLRLGERGNVLAFSTVRDTLERMGRIAVVAAPGAQASADVDRVEVVNGLEVRVRTINGTAIKTYGIPEPASRTTLPPPRELPAPRVAVPTTPK